MKVFASLFPILIFATHVFAQGNIDDRPLVAERVKLIHNVRVPTAEPGVVDRLNVKPGDRVTAGQIVAELDEEIYAIQKASTQIERQIAELTAEDDVDIRFAESSEKVAAKVFERSEKAASDYPKSVSQTELERLKLEWERSELSQEKAKRDGELARMQADLRREMEKEAAVRHRLRKIRSPIDGIVVEIFPQEKEWLHAGAPVLRIISLKKIRVAALALGSRFDYREMVGRRVKFTTRVPPEGKTVSLSGVITFASPELNLDTGRFEIWAEIDNPDGILRPNARGKLELERTDL